MSPHVHDGAIVAQHASVYVRRVGTRADVTGHRQRGESGLGNIRVLLRGIDFMLISEPIFITSIFFFLLIIGTESGNGCSTAHEWS